MKNDNKTLSTKQQSIVSISAFTAKSDVTNLKLALNEGLDAGLTINEIKEELVHLYAYCGFPLSIRGINTFNEVLKEREAKGIKDSVGKEASSISDTETRFLRGEKAQMIVTGMTAQQLTDNFAFCPLIDVYLKEHLFGDIFDRDVLSFIEREIVTVSALSAMHDPFVRSHIGGALNVGVSAEQLREIFAIVETKIGKKEAETSLTVLEEVLKARSN